MKKFLVCLSLVLVAGSCLVCQNLSLPVYGHYASDCGMVHGFKNEAGELKGSMIKFQNHRFSDSVDSFDFDDFRVWGFEGINKIRLEFVGKNSNNVFLTRVVDRGSNNFFEFRVRETDIATKIDENFCFINCYDDLTNELLASLDEEMAIGVFPNGIFPDDFRKRYRKYCSCYNMAGELTEAIVSVDATGLQLCLFPERPAKIDGVDCGDVIKSSGLRGQSFIKLKFYDVNDGERFVVEKMAELKNFGNNDNIQIDMRDVSGAPLVCGEKDYKVVCCDMNDKQLCWFRYVVGENLENQSW